MRLLVSRHLENFLVLYETRNMHAAARKKGISQPALTKSLKLLEDELQVELFLRTPHGLESSSAGEALYRHARAIDQEARFASLSVGAVHKNLGGRIKIGVGQVLAVSTFPLVLAKFHRRFPNVEVSVETGISSQLVEGLMRDNFDVVVSALPEMPLPERYKAIALFTTDMVVICNRDHPLRTRRRVSHEDLVEFNRVGFIDDREFDKRSARVFGSRAGRLRPVVQTTSLTIMFGLLASTDYYAIVSNMIVPRAQREGLFELPLEGSLWSLDIELMCKASMISSLPMTVLGNSLRYPPLHPTV